MYKPGAHPDLKTTHLKPYFYVLNNLIRYTIDPKFGDSIHLRQDAPKILARFGANGGRFGVSDFMWNKIADASVDPNKYLPYAPYLMHIIEQVTGMQFSHPCIHAPVRAKHLGAPHAPPHVLLVLLLLVLLPLVLPLLLVLLMLMVKIFLLREAVVVAAVLPVMRCSGSSPTFAIARRRPISVSVVLRRRQLFLHPLLFVSSRTPMLNMITCIGLLLMRMRSSRILHHPQPLIHSMVVGFLLASPWRTPRPALLIRISLELRMMSLGPLPLLHLLTSSPPPLILMVRGRCVPSSTTATTTTMTMLMMTSSHSSSYSQPTLFGTCCQRGSVRLIFDVIS